MGQGTTFRIYLPRAAETAETEPPARPHVRLTGSETILLVKDEPIVRRLAQAVLQENGYRVLVAAHRPEALRMAREHEGAIHLR